MLFLDSHMLSDNICELEEGVMPSVLRNASQSSTRLDKFLFLLISFRGVSGLARIHRGHNRDFRLPASVAGRFVKLAPNLCQGMSSML